MDRVLSYIVDLRHISSLFFTPLLPSNLRPFGAPPSIGRRECPREPLPLEGAAERSETGLASFLGGEAASSLPSLLGKALCREKRYPRIVAFPIGEGFVRRYSFSTYACIRFDDARKAASLYRSLPHWVGFAGGTVFSFLHPSHAKTTVSYERSFLCVLLA